MNEQPKQRKDDRSAIRLLGRLLGEVIREQHGEEAFQLVEGIPIRNRDRRDGPGFCERHLHFESVPAIHYDQS